jgi:tripartite-type tricarboxylate transporter receptor subunit TctC
MTVIVQVVQRANSLANTAMTDSAGAGNRLQPVFIEAFRGQNGKEPVRSTSPAVRHAAMHDGGQNRCHNHRDNHDDVGGRAMFVMSPAAGALARGSLATLGTLVALTAAWLDSARADYPERQVTLIVCFPAGGGTDIAARLISTPLGEAIGKPVIVENRGGAGGNIGINVAARAVPDGHTLLVCSSAFVVNPSLYSQAGYDPFNDFIPLMVLGASPNLITVPAQSPIKSLPAFIEKAKANPGKLNWTSPGAGTTPFLAGELLKLRTGINMLHIPFAGAGPASQAAVAGQVDLYTANLGSVLGQVQAGLLRPIAVTSKRRWPDLADVPTLDELGIKDAESDTFQAVYAPAGTPQPIVNRLVKELDAILARSDTRERFAKAGLPVIAEGPEMFRARITREVPMYRDIIDKAGLKVNSGQ